MCLLMLSIAGNQCGLVNYDLMLTLRNAFSIFISNRDVMYLSDIKSSVEMPLSSVETPLSLVEMTLPSVKTHQDATM